MTGFERENDASVKKKVCYNCGQEGHIARYCTNDRVDGAMRKSILEARAKARRCFNCGKIGHISADCTVPPGNMACYLCGIEGHIARDCSKKTSS